MAVIATYTTSSGATVRIYDDCILPRGSEEERRAVEAQRRAAYNILTARARMGAKKDNGMDQGLQGV